MLKHFTAGAFAIAAVPALFATPAPDASTLRGRVEAQGLAVEVAVEPASDLAAAPGTLMEGEPVRFRFTVRDAATGTPLPRLYPSAWLDRLPAAPAGDGAGDGRCGEKVAAFLGGALMTRPAMDLNSYHVVALNDDGSLTVVDPLFGFGGTKLLALVELAGPGEDWALSADARRLFVSIPTRAQVAVVETSSWDLLTYADVGARPGRVRLQPGSGLVWVAYRSPYAGSERSGVSIVDPRSMKTVERIETGRGEHDVAFSADGRFAFVTNRDDGTLSVVDTGERKVLATLATGPSPVSVDWSILGGTAWVAHSTDGALVAVDPQAEGGPKVVTRLVADVGLAQIRFSPDGRLGLAVNPETDELHVIDAAAGKIVQAGKMQRGPDQVSFSDELAYVRHRGSETVLMVPLAALGREGAPIPVVDTPGGQRPPGEMELPSPAAGIVKAPGALAVLIANPADKAIYYYKEGMAAPMGHFQNYGRRPRAVLVVDRSLRETTAGVYETVSRFDEPGTYDLAFFLDSPRLVHCFPVTVAENPVLAAARARRVGAVEPLTQVSEPAAGKELTLRFKVSDPDDGRLLTGLKDVGVLSFLSPGIWQRREWAEDVGDGVYQVRVTPPREGVYFVFVHVPSLGLRYGETPSIVFHAVEPAPPEAPPAAAQEVFPARTAGPETSR